jgi:hypothetical protein
LVRGRSGADGILFFLERKTETADEHEKLRPRRAGRRIRAPMCVNRSA